MGPQSTTRVSHRGRPSVLLRRNVAGGRGRIEHFGSRRVFMDVHDIDPSADWPETLHDAAAACKVGVVLIGPGFLAHGAQGRSRLSEDEDVMRSELVSLLAGQRHVLPVLVDDAQLPREGDLPQELQPLLRCQARRINNSNWQAVSAEVVGAIEEVLRPSNVGSQGPRVALSCAVSRSVSPP